MKKHNYTRRVFLKTMSAGMAAVMMPYMNSCKGKINEGPNIVLIMADDMGYSDIGCYGGEISTPNLDRLAANGVRFTQFYNTARCCPTRASLLTGLYPHQAGIGHMVRDRGLEGYRGELNNRCVTIAEVLRQTGYATYMCGKWHVTSSKRIYPLQRGFDHFYGTISGAGNYFSHSIMHDNKRSRVTSGDHYYTDAISDNAVNYINQHAKTKPDVPFFCYVAYTAPHWPLHAPKEDIVRYKGRFDKGWDVLRIKRLKRMVEMGIIDKKWKLTNRDSSQLPWELAENKEWQLRRMEVYAAQIDRMDRGIGRIVSELERTNNLENTLIFFLSDNGGCAEEIKVPEKKKTANGHKDGPLRSGNNPSIMPGPADTYQSYGVPWANVSNTPFRMYKHWVHEGGISTPLLVHWPLRIKSRGELRHQSGHLIDIMTTCVDVSKATYPALYKDNEIIPMEGRSLVPAFNNKPIEREAIYWEHEGNRAVRTGKWKLVAKDPKGPWELYDMEKDRTETDNIASQYPERVKQMAAMWQKWAERTNTIPWPW